MLENIVHSNFKLFKLAYVFLMFQRWLSEWYYCYNNPKQTNHAMKFKGSVYNRPLLRPHMINSNSDQFVSNTPKSILEKIWSPWKFFKNGKKGKTFLLDDNNIKTFNPAKIILDFVCFSQPVLFTELLFAGKTRDLRMQQSFSWYSIRSIPKINWFMVSTVYPSSYGCIWVFIKH